MNRNTRERATTSLSIALLVVTTTGAACFRTPLDDATGSAPDGGAGCADALNLIHADAYVAPDLPHDLLPDVAPDLPRDLVRGRLPDLLPDVLPDLAPDLRRDVDPAIGTAPMAQ